MTFQMKYSAAYIVILVTISSFLYFFSTFRVFSQSATIRCNKTVIDTVRAMDFIKDRVDEHNTKCFQRIEELQKQKSIADNKDTAAIKDIEVRIEDCLSDLYTMPDSFSSEAWWNVFRDSDIPTKDILVTRDAVGIDTIQFKDLVNHFCRKDPDLIIFSTQLSAIGKFDGLISDRIGAFPANETRDKILIKSMLGTVPPLWISPGFEVDVLLVEICNSFWEHTPVQRDGLEIKAFFPESTDGVRLFYYFDGKEWRETLPLNSESLSYDECAEIVKSQGAEPILIKGNWSEENSDLPSSFLVMSDETLYKNPKFPGDHNNVLKYKIDTGSEILNGNCAIKTPDNSWSNIFVIRNYEDSGKDVIAVEYMFSKEGYRLRTRDIYIPVRDTSGIMTGPRIKGRNFDRSIYLKKIAEGTLNFNNNKWYMKSLYSDD